MTADTFPAEVSTADIAKMLGLSVDRVRDHIVHRADFPKPSQAFSARSRRWWRHEVEAWRARAGQPA